MKQFKITGVANNVQYEIGNYKTYSDEEFNKIQDALKMVMTRVKKNFVVLGAILADLSNCENIYKLGYKNIYEYAEERFGLGKTSVKNLIMVNARFCKKQEPTQLEECYEKYNYTQLVEMSSIHNLDECEISPDMTIKEIRELKKNLIEIESGQSTDQLEEPEEISTNRLILNNKEEREQWLNDYKNWGLWKEDIDLDLKFYKYNFTNGDYLIATEYYPYYTYSNNNELSVKYCLIVNNEYEDFKCKHFDLTGVSKTFVVDYLTKQRETIKGKHYIVKASN